MKLLLSLLACLVINSCFAQPQEDKLYVFDKNGQLTSVKMAAYLLRVRQVSQKNYLWTYYNIFGPRVSQENFSDETGKIRNGKCLYYFNNGFLDSTGEYVNDIPDGSHYFYNEKGRVVRQKDYEKGVIIRDTLFVERKEDSSIKVEPVPGEVESAFPGGQKGWVKFLTKNFNYPPRALNSAIAGTVRLQFIIDKNGNVAEPEINKSVEYSLDEEALRIINKSPQWKPAMKDGIVLKSYKIQPITFQLTR